MDEIMKKRIHYAVSFITGTCYRYVSFVERSTAGKSKKGKEDILYWRDVLFTKFITYLLPTCLIALIPGVFMALELNLIFIAYADLITVFTVAAVALNSRLSLAFRKAFIIGLMYLFSIVLFAALSQLGPGISYLLTLSVLMTTFFSKYWGYVSVIFNFTVCVCCSLIIHFKIFDLPLTRDYSLGTWIAVSSNLVFLSLVIVALVSETIQGLERVILKEGRAKKDLKKEVSKGIISNMMLKESESHFKSLFFQNPSPVWVLENDSLRFLQVNEAACLQYGYTNEEFLSMTLMDIRIGESLDGVMKKFQNNRYNDIPGTMIAKHIRKNKKPFYVEVVFNSILFEGKIATISILTDITEQVNYIQAIEKQNERFREIGWIQSHKVRGPLSSILGLAKLLETGDSTNAEIEEMIRGIQTASLQLDDVIREIVDKTCVGDVQIIPNSQYKELAKLK